MTKRSLHQVCLLLTCLLFSNAVVAGALERLFAPKAELWAYWEVSDPAATRRVDHSAWQAFLHRYVMTGADGINRVRYGSVGAADRQALQHYIERLESLPIREYAPAEQQAYWINLYNAATVRVVLDHYPVASIRDIDISPGLFADGPWGSKLLTVEGEPVSLNDIEHRILRPIWQDPRLHYALNCASLGCPNLGQEAYSAAHLDQQLDAAARTFVNSPRGVRIENGGLNVSSIYSWFNGDFGGSDRQVIEHLRRYAAPALASRLRAFDRIEGDDYDWRLNDAP